MPTTINRKLYPELDKLLWDVHCETVDPEFTFRAYEKRWGFVQAQNLSDNEQSLINELTRTVGQGIFIPAFGLVQNDHTDSAICTIITK
ncbi:hypothetical protein [Candidatus Thiothrix anitrata]|uniref:Uncharacterized protein n=1 Tax=Candidatus Thiothrix anitrata TaxID=2823902 RepID=A0ABX7X8C3_9GAMM|nr:hypothetical protein [Candidatus Thiothrix anitrata]QTR51180.1 hypothetical protein J8380_06415 [Candidatus Thiothrix anitrata]